MPIPCRRTSAEGLNGRTAKRLGRVAAAFVLLAATALPVHAQDAAQTAPTLAPAQTSPAVPVETPPSEAPAPTGASPAAPAPSPATPPAPVTSEPAEAPSAAPAASPDSPPPTVVGGASLPHDLSPWGMFMAADIVVKSVMTALAVAAVATWVIWLAKTLELVGARARIRRGLSALEQAEGLNDLEGEMERRFKRGPVAALVRSAIQEKKRSADLAPDGIKERVAISIGRIEARAGRNMARGTGILATIGSISPFVGLFGTVWGIMNSFIGISQSNTTNLAVVAPGIAEALLATAIGLVAAIPAVVFYNVFSRAIGGYRTVLSDASAEVMRHLSRDLDRERRAGIPPRRRLEAAE
ncbi:tonB-system energizer ExbB [Aureimonas psammosilenae]|uniref:tonB-system energizer ExbB n=1 Tax=Aureimonas psammosilenae TaxID=2495496 RepID=UPI0012605B94|nr:tonB-system energizer ExbB [Aureimonas psammosilenae]